MLTGNIRNQIDTVWNSFWAGGIANPLEVIEQITYLLLAWIANCTPCRGFKTIFSCDPPLSPLAWTEV
jgi:hypothetical protein